MPNFPGLDGRDGDVITIYPLVKSHNYGKSPCLVGKSTISWPCSIAMLNYQRVCVRICWHILACHIYIFIYTHREREVDRDRKRERERDRLK